MKVRVGRPKLLEVGTLRNRTWAHAVLNRSGLSPNKIALFYPPTAGGLDSTLFHKTLDIGRPTPRLWLRDGSDGPAVRLEKEWPGTLTWLLHPLWSTIDLVDLPLLHTVYTSMSALGESTGIQMVKVDPTTGEVSRVSNALEDLELLASNGSLDALALVVLHAQEAFIQCRISAYERIAQFAVSEVPGWTCLRWAPAELRKSLVTTVLDCVQELSPAQVPVPQLANRYCLTQSLLMLDQIPRTSKDLSDLDRLLSGVACPHAQP